MTMDAPDEETAFLAALNAELSSDVSVHREPQAGGTAQEIAGLLARWEQYARDRDANLAALLGRVEEASRQAREREDRYVIDLRAELDTYPQRLTGPGTVPPAEPEPKANLEADFAAWEPEAEL